MDLSWSTRKYIWFFGKKYENVSGEILSEAADQIRVWVAAVSWTQAHESISGQRKKEREKSFALLSLAPYTTVMSTRFDILNLMQIQLIWKSISVKDNLTTNCSIRIICFHQNLITVQMSEGAVFNPISAKGALNVMDHSFLFEQFPWSSHLSDAFSLISDIFQTCCCLSYSYSPFPGCLVSAVALPLPEKIRRGHFLWISLRLIFMWDALRRHCMHRHPPCDPGHVWGASTLRRVGLHVYWEGAGGHPRGYLAL